MAAHPQLNPLNKQVIVIAGASSGIGLATAREAARRGAHLVLVARNANALNTLVGDLRRRGAKAVGVAADVSVEKDVEHVGDVAISIFGRIDSWVNNAGLGIYGEFSKVPLEDQRKLFDINYWGVVHGSAEALKRIKGPGAIINLGSVLSDVPMPLQSTYTASKHAVKGLTDTLRIETEKSGRPISITLIKPAAIDTPFADHARSHDQQSPATPPPRYAPELVAETILRACETPMREAFVGGAALAMTALWRTAPSVFEWYARKMLYGQQRQRLTSRVRPMRDNLYAPRRDGEINSVSTSGGSGRQASLYQAATLNPALSASIALAAVGGVVAAWVMRRAGGGSQHPPEAQHQRSGAMSSQADRIGTSLANRG